jgi:hypothetical protein
MAVRQLLYLDKEANASVDLTSGAHMHQVLEMFVAYRVLDLLAVVEGIPSPVAIPKQIKAKNLGCMEKHVCFDHL